MAAIAIATRIAAVMLCLLATSAVAACGSSSTSPATATTSASLAAACRPASAPDQTVTTPAYVFLLHIGSPEKMLMITAAQARSRHITTGELMIGGSMAGMSSGAMNGRMTTRHLELHICHRANGTVVTGAMPAITAAPSSDRRTPEHLPVAAMEGVVAGAADLHYGNNVSLHPGTTYTIAVRLGADRAAFKYAVPRNM